MEHTDSELEKLCISLTVPLWIGHVYDDRASRAHTMIEDGFHVLLLNTAKIPTVDYEVYAGYHVGKILLPEMRLETEIQLLRHYQDGDAAQCFTFLSNSEDAYMDCCKPFEKMDEAYYERVALLALRETQYLITMKEIGEAIGTVQILPDDSRAVDASAEKACGIRQYGMRGWTGQSIWFITAVTKKENVNDSFG